MKYKIGDRVRIKTWENMEKEYGVNSIYTIINCQGGFSFERERKLNKYHPNRVLTINKIAKSNYLMRERKNNSYYGGWSDDMIECLAEEYKEPVPITSRWEILDL